MKLLELVVMTAMLVGTGAPPAFANEVHQFDIPREDAAAAIRDFAVQAHVQILVAGESVSGKQLHPVKGQLSTEAGLNILLDGSGLAHRYVGDRSVALLPASAASTTATVQAQGSSSSPSTPGSPEEAAKREPVRVEEVVVTAQKREERMQDVPIPLTVLNGNELAETSQVNLRDYYLAVPGFNVTPGYSATQDLSIRGITTGGFSTPTVGVMIDDVTYGNSTAVETNIVPDVDPGDLARIEVLRGPQGTLYGANSMGGLIKYVTIDPSTAAYGGRVEVGTSGVYNGAESGFNVRAAVNIPLGDTLAVRVSGFRRQDPGYIDNPSIGRTGVNEAQADGAHLAMLWQPSSDFSLKLSAIYQNTRQGGVSEIDTGAGLGDLQQNYVPGTGGFIKKVEAYSANLKWHFGGIDLTSITGYNINRLSDSFDYTYYLSGQTQQLFGTTATPYTDWAKGEDLSEELRLAGAFGPHFDWLLGGIYRREMLADDARFWGSDPTSGRYIGQSVDFGYSTNLYKEYAGFADLTYHFAYWFDLQLGARETHISQLSNPVTVTGPLTEFFYGAPSPYIVPALRSTSNTFTYLVTPRFKLSEDFMIYIRLASGFRPGGSNQVGPGIPTQYNPDKTYNYEVGLKADLLQHRLSLDGAIYYINWKNIQFQLMNDTGFPYNGNGGSARSAGVEMSSTLRPMNGITISGWVDYDDDVLTQTVTNSPYYLVDGARIPNTSRWTGNVSLSEEVPLGSQASGFFNAAWHYVGGRQGLFQPTADRQYYPSYTRTDLRAGVKYESWTATLYANNVANVRGILNGGVGYLYPFAFVVSQPRTIGASLSKTF